MGNDDASETEIRRIPMGRRGLSPEYKPTPSKWFGRVDYRPEFRALNWFVIKSNIKCEERAASSLEAAGFVPYLPKQKFEIIHHRTKAVLDKEVNLFKQYVFVGFDNDKNDWFTLRDCDGVERPLGVDGPVRMKAEVVEEFWEKEHRLEFDDTREAQLHRKEIGRTLRETTRLRFPVNSTVRIELAGVPFFAKVRSVNARGAIEAMADMLGRMVPVEVWPEEVELLDVPGEAA
jgi:transcription termination/antitermination protein NusG